MLFKIAEVIVKIKKVITIIMLLIILNLIFFCNYSFANNSTNLEIHSEAAILIDSKTGKIIYEKNSNEKRYPASTTKILTAILAIEKFSLDEEVTASYNAVMSIPSGYSIAAIQVGETLTVKELLEVFLVHSANEAGYILAEGVSGSISEFAKLMNQKAQEIGCKNTHFTNPSGLHDENHYSTAYDLAQIAKYCMQNKTFRSIVSMPTCTVEPSEIYEERFFRNTNEMLNPKSQYYNEYIIGIKTGYTSLAKNCLISGYKKNNTELISVVLGAPASVGDKGLSGKYTDTQTLFDYGIENYSYKNIIPAGEVVTQIEVEHATNDTKNLDLVLEKNIEAFISNSIDLKNLKPEISLNENITAPISANDVLGTATFTIDGETYTRNLVASNNVEASAYLKNILKILLAIVLLLIVFELMYLKKNNNTKKDKKKGPNGKYLYGRVKY